MFENVTSMSNELHKLENASETIFYDDSLELINDRCPITLATFQSGDRLRRILYCHHIFTEDAFIRWFQENVCCPVCRFDIRTHNSPISGNDEGENNEDENIEDEINEDEINEDENNEDEINEDEINEDEINEDEINEDEINEDEINEDEINEDEINEDPQFHEDNNGYITTIGTTESYTFTNASTNNNIGSYPPLPPPPTSNLNNTIESMLQTAIMDSSNNIVNNLSQYLLSLSKIWIHLIFYSLCQ